MTASEKRSEAPQAPDLAVAARPPRPPVWRTLLAIGISAAFLVWAVLRVSKDADAFWVSLKQAELFPILVAVALATSLFPLRIFRWRLLLRHPDGSNLTVSQMWHPIAMGFMANNILPFRAGEFVRVFSVSRLSGVGFAASLSSIVAERLFDGLALLLLLTLAFFSPGIPNSLTIGGVSVARTAVGAGVVSAIGLLLAGAIVAFPQAAERLVDTLVPSRRWAARVLRLVHGVRDGLAVLKSPRRLVGVVLWSVALWVINGLSFYVAFKAFAIPVDVMGAFLVQGILAIGIAAPSAPGYVGVFEFLITQVLSLYGVDPTVALAYAVTYHVATFIPITVLGLWSVAATGLGFRTLRQA